MACPTCGEDGEYYRGTPRAELWHFLNRAIWALHRARQAAELLVRFERSRAISKIIDYVEALAEDTSPGND